MRLFRSHFTLFSRGRHLSFVLKLALGLLMLALGGCDFRTLPNCASYFEEPPERPSRFRLTANGLATLPELRGAWSRCPAGMRFTRRGDCVGAPVALSWDQALLFAAEAAEKAGQPLRLPTRSEMATLTESSCLNPALDLNVFPAAVSQKLWTSEASAFAASQACSVYTYQGSSTCNESKETELGFFLIIDPL